MHLSRLLSIRMNVSAVRTFAPTRALHRQMPHSSSSTAATSTSTDEEQPQQPQQQDTLRATLRDLPGPVVSALADELLLCGAFSASVDEYRAPGSAEQKIFGARGRDGRRDACDDGGGSFRSPSKDSGAVFWDRCTLTAIFDPAADVSAALTEASLAAGVDCSVLPEPELSEARASEWLDALRGAFSPVFIEAGSETGGRGLWILPEGCSLPPQAGEVSPSSPSSSSGGSKGDRDEEKERADVVVRLTPGLAFGTGAHPTTRMCLRWLATDEVVRALRARGGRDEQEGGASLLDFGTGSGVLSAAAIALGCRFAVGTDIDPLALTAAEENAALNASPPSMAAAEAAPPPPLRTVLVPPDPPEQSAEISGDEDKHDSVGPPGSFDVVVANILRGPLLRLAPALARYAAPGAPVAVSGVLASQAKDVAAAFAGAGVELTEFARERCGWDGREEASGGEEGWWVCLSGRKRL